MYKTYTNGVESSTVFIIIPECYILSNTTLNTVHVHWVDLAHATSGSRWLNVHTKWHPSQPRIGNLYFVPFSTGTGFDSGDSVHQESIHSTTGTRIWHSPTAQLCRRSWPVWLCQLAQHPALFHQQMRRSCLRWRSLRLFGTVEHRVSEIGVIWSPQRIQPLLLAVSDNYVIIFARSLTRDIIGFIEASNFLTDISWESLVLPFAFWRYKSWRWELQHQFLDDSHSFARAHWQLPFSTIHSTSEDVTLHVWTLLWGSCSSFCPENIHYKNVSLILSTSLELMLPYIPPPSPYTGASKCFSGTSSIYH